MNLMRIINWPRTRQNNLAPLWAVALRLVALPLLVLGGAMVSLSLLIGWGPYEARKFWRDL